MRSTRCIARSAALFTALVGALAIASCDSGGVVKKSEMARAPEFNMQDQVALDALQEQEPAELAEKMDVSSEERSEQPQKKTAREKDSADEEEKKTWKRSKKVANTSKLSVGQDQDLPIRGMSVSARVDGWRARILIDFYFLNDTERTLEGTFKLRLPDGATPYFLAFGQSTFSDDAKLEEAMRKESSSKALMKTDPDEILLARKASWIEPKVARMVPKEQAAYAYTETTRRRVDPALMEWAGAGIFNARVFPLAPKKVHRVVVGYDM
ncbi:MAG: hypothetical protein AAGI01_11390, partial [Myxococcota bacterium]